MKPVLIAYASHHGSTREVAEAVGVNLKEQGIDVDLRAARDVESLEDYPAVVLGASLYFFRIHGGARRFLARNRRALREMPVAVFGMGPLNESPKEFEGARQHLDRSLAKRPWVSPAAVAVFGGRLDPSGLRFPHKNPAMKQIPASDIRDWEAIRTWADSLPETHWAVRVTSRE
jgi:menaquinone-dependent protoporphyrinogen oxidase